MNKWIKNGLLSFIFFFLLSPKAFALAGWAEFDATFHYNDYAELYWGNPSDACSEEEDQSCFYFHEKNEVERPLLKHLQKINITKDPANPLALIQAQGDDRWYIYDLEFKGIIFETENFEEGLQEWRKRGLADPQFATHAEINKYFKKTKESKIIHRGLFMLLAIAFILFYLPYFLWGLGAFLVLILVYYFFAKNYQNRKARVFQ